MEPLKFVLPVKKMGAPRNPREFVIDKIRTLLGNRVVKEKGVLKDKGRLWTYRELGIYLKDVPVEWLKQYYSASVDAQNPARHFCWLIKETKKTK